jgi:hypothetical protein
MRKQRVFEYRYLNGDGPTDACCKDPFIYAFMQLQTETTETGT